MLSNVESPGLIHIAFTEQYKPFVESRLFDNAGAIRVKIKFMSYGIMTITTRFFNLSENNGNRTSFVLSDLLTA